jgi:hypothetical protein
VALDSAQASGDFFKQAAMKNLTQRGKRTESGHHLFFASWRIGVEKESDNAPRRSYLPPQIL